MRVWFAVKRQDCPIQGDLVDSASAALDPVTQFDRAFQQGGGHAQAIERGRYHWIGPQGASLGTDAEETSDDQADGNSCAAGVNTPATVERNRIAADALVFLARLVPIRKRRIRARVVAV